MKELEKKREVFGRLMQCRTGHGYIGEYYAKFVPTENVDCPCGKNFQTREHILRDCPRYEAHRHTLREFSEDISIPEILGTTKGITALATFIEESGAFTKSGEPRKTWSAPTWENTPDTPDSDSEEDGGERWDRPWESEEEDEGG